MKDEILVVDDEEVCRDLLQDIVVDCTGRSCRTVASAAAALELLCQPEEFALAIFDAHMPGMSGIELLRKVNDVQPDLDVIVVTGYKGQYSFVDVIRAGASDYMTKPFKVDEVDAKIKRVLRERALITELKRNSARRRATHNDLARSYSEAASHAEFERARDILDSAPDGILIIDEGYTIQFANAAIETMFDMTTEEAVGEKCFDMCGKDGVCEVCPARTVFETRVPGHATRMVRNKYGEVLFYELRAVPLAQDHIDRVQVMEFVRDVTDIREVEAELRRLSIKDTLTELSNRRHFLEVLEREMYRSKRQGTPLTLLFTDIDSFKEYNDAHGHLAGDDLLVKVSQIIGHCIRGGVDTAYRLGGDEFTAVLPHTDIVQGIRVSKRLLKRFRREKVPNTSLSIGVIEYDHEMDMVEFVDAADKAMYRAKKTGGDRIEKG